MTWKLPFKINVNINLYRFFAVIGLLFVLAVVLIELDQNIYADAFIGLGTIFLFGILLLPMHSKKHAK